RPKVIAIEEAQNLKTPSLEVLISNLKSHEMVLNADEARKKNKLLKLLLCFVASQSTRTSSKALNAKSIEIFRR
ncbi:hypothetical protein L195_g005398, partial [Trifolium pratense]